MDKTCFAYDHKNICRALNDDSGCGPGCPFRKGVAEHKAGMATANRRLAGLSEDRQQYIAETYYRGKRPWLKPRREGGDAL